MILRNEAQIAFRDAAANFPAPLGSLGGLLMNIGVAPLGNFTRPYAPAGDALTREVAGFLTRPSGLRDLFAKDVYAEGRVADLVKALPICVEADALQAMLRKEKRTATASEQHVLDTAMTMRDALVQVDVFDKHGPLEKEQGYERPAIVQTKQWAGGVPSFAEDGKKLKHAALSK